MIRSKAFTGKGGILNGKTMAQHRRELAAADAILRARHEGMIPDDERQARLRSERREAEDRAFCA